MRVKYNIEVSEEYDLIGGGPQGTLFGGIEYLVQSNNNADCVDDEDRFKNEDDLSILKVLCLTGFLIQYDTHQHVSSFYLITCHTWTDLVMMPHVRIPRRVRVSSDTSGF